MEETHYYYLSLILIIVHGLQSGGQGVENMTMFSTANQQLYGYKSSSYYYDDDTNCIGTDLVTICQQLIMAKDESQQQKDQGWLQLSIGGITTQPAPAEEEENNTRDGSGLVELELLPGTSSNSSSFKSPLGPIHDFRPPRQFSNFPGFSPLSNFLHHQQQHSDPRNSSFTTDFHRQPEINTWTSFRPVNNTTASFSYPLSTSVASGSYYSRPPFQIYPGMDLRPAPVVTRPGLDFRVIPPPRRPHCGIWFKLQAWKNEEREVSLPQISKSYLRIKDGRMTIRLVIKYLVNRLSLEINESEIEIRCKGERVEPLLTLQHVRDNIWNRDSAYVTLLPNSSTVDHIMVLHYAYATTTGRRGGTTASN